MTQDAAAQAKGRINLETAHALLIESSSQGMDILTQIVTGFGVRGVSKASGIEDAWKLVRMADFDLILCSARHGDGDGYDFIAELRRSALEPNRFTSVIALNGHTPMAGLRKARDCGASFVVAKPISARVLLERIIWIAREQRAFIEASDYVGPDRRFRNLGAPEGLAGRRKEDAEQHVGGQARTEART